MTTIGSGVTITGGVTFTAPPPGPTLYTVTNWDLLEPTAEGYITQIDCLDNTGAPYTILAALPVGSTIVLVQGGGNITVTTTTTATTIPFLNRVTLNVSGYSSASVSGTQLIV